MHFEKCFCENLILPFSGKLICEKVIFVANQAQRWLGVAIEANPFKPQQNAATTQPEQKILNLRVFSERVIPECTFPKHIFLNVFFRKKYRLI